MMTTAQKVAAVLRGDKVPACKWNCLKWEWGRDLGVLEKLPPPGYTCRSGAIGMCMEEQDSCICTLPAGHEGQHVACWSPGKSNHGVAHAWDNINISKEQQPTNQNQSESKNDK